MSGKLKISMKQKEKYFVVNATNADTKKNIYWGLDFLDPQMPNRFETIKNTWNRFQL